MKVKTRSQKEITAPPKFDKIHRKIQKEKKVEGGNNHNPTFYLIWFLVFVGIFIGIAFITRIVILFQKSTFKTTSYSVFVQNEKPLILVYEKTLPKLSVISLPVSQENKLQASIKYGIPLDSGLKTNSNQVLNFAQVFNVIFSPWNFYYENMTLIDHLRLIIGASSIPENKINRATIKINTDKEIEGMSEQEIYSIFKDPQIINESLSITVVNATNVDGLGGRVAQIVERIGGNIVSVSSSAETKKSTLTATKDSTTLKRISELLEIKPKVLKKGSAISDIKIVLGKDFEKRIR